jgi:hypothetical protein
VIQHQREVDYVPGKVPLLSSNSINVTLTLPLVRIAFRTYCQLVCQKNGRNPGLNHAYEQDVSQIQDCIVEVADAMELLKEDSLVQDTSSGNKFAQELTRYGQAEIHAIASLIGSMASQEAVKVIAGQYVPLNNAYIYNGVDLLGGVYQF